MPSIQRQKQELMKRFLLVFAPALLAGLAASWLLARSVRNALLGHEPSAFARMYLQREDVLDHLSECLLAVAPDGKILFTNAQARKLFRSDELPADFPLWEEIHAAFDEGVSRADLLTEWAELFHRRQTAGRISKPIKQAPGDGQKAHIKELSHEKRQLLFDV